MFKQLKWNGKRESCFVVLLLVLISGTGSWAARTENPGRLSKAELKNLLTNAKTAADHERLAEYFNTNAGKLEAEAQDYEERAVQFKRNPGPDESKHPMSGRTYAGCQFIAGNLRQKAKEIRQLAVEHMEMAGKEAK